MIDFQEVGGRDRDRTGDPLLAKQVLSQLSYTPTCNYMIPIVSLIEFRENDYLLCWQLLTQIDGSTHHVQPSPYEVLTMTS